MRRRGLNPLRAQRADILVIARSVPKRKKREINNYQFDLIEFYFSSRIWMLHGKVIIFIFCYRFLSFGINMKKRRVVIGVLGTVMDKRGKAR